MSMTKRDSQGISGVLLRALIQFKQILHHFPDLIFFRPTFAHNGLFYLGEPNIQTLAHRPASLPQ